MKNASLAIMPLTSLVGFLDCEVHHSQTIRPLTAAGHFHMECMQKTSRRLVGWSHIHSSGEVYPTTISICTISALCFPASPKFKQGDDGSICGVCRRSCGLVCLNNSYERLTWTPPLQGSLLITLLYPYELCSRDVLCVIVKMLWVDIICAGWHGFLRRETEISAPRGFRFLMAPVKLVLAFFYLFSSRERLALNERISRSRGCRLG